MKPNFTDDLGVGTHQGQFCLFVGRLSPEKGIDVLLDAWKRLHGQIPLIVVGDGPVQTAAANCPAGVQFLGRQSREQVRSLMQHATLAIVPSICYENFPLAIAEAFSAGLPVVASQLGALEELVDQNRTGWLVAPSNAEALAETVQSAWHRSEELHRKSENARAEYEARFTPNANYASLMEIYKKAMAQSTGSIA